MSFADYFIIALTAVFVAAAVISIIKQRRQGGCKGCGRCGGCDTCGKNKKK